MDVETKNLVAECSLASDEERILFPEIVRRLAAAGVERYHSDLVRAERTYYMPDGSMAVTPTQSHADAAAAEFSATQVEAAVRAIQRQEIQYLEFCRRIIAAGCVGYFVSIAGRRAVYYGRTLDSYVEPFPPAR